MAAKYNLHGKNDDFAHIPDRFDAKLVVYDMHTKMDMNIVRHKALNIVHK